MSRIVQNVEEVVLAVNHQDEVVALFEDLFELEFKESWSVPVDNMNVKCARIGNTQFHIVSSTSPNAVIAKYLLAPFFNTAMLITPRSNLLKAVSRIF